MAKTPESAVEPAVRVSPAPYLPFRTFLSSIEALEQGVPKIIDRTIWRSQSGIVQSQILMALRFFGLVDDEDRPTELLHELAAKKENRAEHFVRLLNFSYTALLAHDLTKMTPKMVEDEMERYNVTGDTKRKAVTFFLRMAKFAGMPMHPLLSSQVRNTGPRRKRGSKRNLESTIVVAPNSADSGILSRKTKSVDLRSGNGVVALTLSYDPFSLSKEDRKFVFELIDKLQEYEDGNGSGDDTEEEGDTS